MSLNSPSPTLTRSPDDEGLSRGREGSAELDRRSPVSHGRSPSPSPLRGDSHERSPRGRGSPPPAHYDEESENQGNSIHCGGLPRDMTEDELREKMGAYGRITSCSIPYDPHTRESRGFGFITYASVEEATRAVEEFTDGSIRVQKSRRCKPRAATPGRYLGRDRNRERRPYDRRSREDRYDRYEGSRRGPSYDRYPDRDRRYERSDYDRGYDRSYDRSYDRGGYDRPRYDDRRSDRGRYSPSYSRDRRSPPRY